MSNEAQAVEANDGEQSKNNDGDDEYAGVPAEIVDPHDDLGTYDAAKVAFARMLTANIEDSGYDFPFEADDVKWAVGSSHTLVDGEEVGLAGDAVDKDRRAIWVFQVFDQLVRAASTPTEGELTAVTVDSVDGDRFQRMYEELQPVFIESAEHLSRNGLNEGLRSAGYHPDDFLVEAPKPKTTSEPNGPSDDVIVTPDGTELRASQADEVLFDPKTGTDLQEVELKSEADLAAIEDPSDYLNDGVEYEIPEVPESEESDEEQEGDDATQDEVEIQSVSGVGEATAEKLKDAGITTRSELQEADNDELKEAGVGAATIGAIRSQE